VNVSRIVFILAIIWGTLIYSFFIVSMNVLTTLTEDEREVYDQIVRNEKQQEQYPQAESVIFNFLIYHRRAKKKQKLVKITKSKTYALHYT
jgi:hypothetical protein